MTNISNSDLVFVIKISSFFLLKNDSKEDNFDEIYLRQLSWIKSLLIKNDLRYSFEIRILYLPSSIEKPDANIDVYLIVRATNIEEELFNRYCKSLFNLTINSFAEYSFEIVDVGQIKKIIKPFKMNFVSELKRSVEIINLDTFENKPQKEYGLNQHEIMSANTTELYSTIRHVAPFKITKNPANTFIKLLASSESNVMFSINIQQESPNDRLTELINHQILICERYLQLNLTNSSDPDNLYPALKEKARYYQDFQNKLFDALTEFPLTVSIFAASEKPLPGILINSFASYLISDNSKINFKQRHDNYKLSLEILDSANLFSVSNESGSITFYPGLGDDPDNTEYQLVHTVGLRETASIFSFPLLDVENLEGIAIKRFRYIPTFEKFPQEGVELGYNLLGNKKNVVKITNDDVRRHVYIIGQTGTGKTNLLKNMIISDIKRGNGLCLIDPHGDLYYELLSEIPKERIKDVVIIDPTDINYPVGINLLEYKTESQRYFIAQEMVNILKTLMIDEFGAPSVSNFAGPIFFQHVKMNLLLVMSDPNKMSSLFDFYNIFQIHGYWKNWLPLKISDQHLENWVKSVLPATDYQKQGSEGASLGAYISSKFEQFLFDPMLRNIFSQSNSTINFKDIMDSGKILLVNLAKGELSQNNSRFLGLVIMAKLQSEALQRIKIEKSLRKDFFVYIDEFQSITTENFVSLLSEGRKFRISLILANQFISQIPDNIQKAIFGNAGTLISFRTGLEDALVLERRFYPYISKMDLINLPNWNAYISTLNIGVPVPPFSFNTLFGGSTYNEKLVREIYSLSRSLYSFNKSVSQN